MVEAQLFRAGCSEAVSTSFDTLTLRFPATSEWPDAVWEFVTGASIMKYPAPSIAEIAASTGRFEASIIDPEGMCHGPYSIQTVICGYPNFTFCFLFHADAAGTWSGHTVSTSFGRIVVVPYRTDPA